MISQVIILLYKDHKVTRPCQILQAISTGIIGHRVQFDTVNWDIANLPCDNA